MKPRITANDELDSYRIDVHCREGIETPSGYVSISYDHDDPDRALQALDTLTANVRAQIERTTKP